MPRRSSSDTIVPSDPTSDDLLPGVRVNPNRRRLDHNPFRRRVFFNMDPENTEVEEEETQGDGQPAGAERRLVPPPGLGPREGQWFFASAIFMDLKQHTAKILLE